MVGKLLIGQYRKHSNIRSKPHMFLLGIFAIGPLLKCGMAACSTYGDVIPGHVLADRIASYIHIFNLYWYVR